MLQTVLEKTLPGGFIRASHFSTAYFWWFLIFSSNQAELHRDFPATAIPLHPHALVVLGWCNLAVRSL